MRRSLANLLLALGSVTAVLLVAELGLRLFVGPVPPHVRAPWFQNRMRAPESIRAPSPFPGVPYLLAHGTEVVHDFDSNPRGYFDGDGTLTYRTNSLGWREREFERQKRNGIFRIVGIGDSFTFGTGVRREHLFLTRLQAALDRERPRRYEVINLGVMGFNAAHEAALLQHYGVALNPDLVLVCFVLNDAEVLIPRQFRMRRLSALPPKPAGARPWSLLAEHLSVRLQNRKRNRQFIEKMRRNFEPDDAGWQQAVAALRLEKSLARRHGFQLVLVVFPLLWDLGDGYPFAGIHAEVAAAGHRLDIPVLDLLQAFQGQETEALWVHPSNHHPNEKAHSIAARALFAFLNERGLLDAGSPGASLR
ncbi:MAG: SGNH/GDSL hydrolase family protein [Myxococcales bacterium]|nr:SGNH/GDSL hydrolase family protein [Myxococcales bacterium]